MARRVSGEAVTFVRGDLTIDIEKATRGSTVWDRESVFPAHRIGSKSTDWLIEKSLLLDEDGNQLEPAKFDVIIAEAGSFEVLPFGQTKQLWQWHDREGRTIYRIHTKERS